MTKRGIVSFKVHIFSLKPSSYMAKKEPIFTASKHFPRWRGFLSTACDWFIHFAHICCLHYVFHAQDRGACFLLLFTFLGRVSWYAHNCASPLFCKIALGPKSTQANNNMEIYLSAMPLLRFAAADQNTASAFSDESLTLEPRCVVPLLSSRAVTIEEHFWNWSVTQSICLRKR